MKQIPVYRAEKEAGLFEKIQASASIAYYSPVFANKSPNIDVGLIQSLPAIKNRAIATNQNQVDLFYLKDILVSTGMNLNDDVFDLAETWAARNTAEDKQFNLGHNRKVVEGKVIYVNDTIGHMTSQWCIDDKGETIADDATIEDLPSKFHIVSSAVIYRYWPDSEYMEKINSIIAEIEAQTEDKPKWFVSMEALFANFDYALVDSKGKQTVVPRTEASAFLTKHLRTYGGKGVYKDYKVGRLLRNIVFSGKGLVENPANPQSVIFNDTKPFKAAASEINPEVLNGLGYAFNSNEFFKENKSMNEVEILKKQLDETKAALAVEQNAKAGLQKQLTDEANKSVQAKVEELNKTAEAAIKAKTDLEAQLKVKADEVEKANKALAEANDKLAKASEALKKVEEDKRALARKGELVNKLKLDEASANELAETLSALSDEAFAKYVEKAPKAEAAKTTDDEEAKKKKNKEEEEAYAKSEAGKAEAAKKALENAAPNKEIGSANASANADVEATRKKIAETYNAARAGKRQNDETAKN